MPPKCNKAQEFPDIKRKIIMSLLGRESHYSFHLSTLFIYFILWKTSNYTKSRMLVLIHRPETKSSYRKDHTLEYELLDFLQIPFMPMELLIELLELALNVCVQWSATKTVIFIHCHQVVLVSYPQLTKSLLMHQVKMKKKCAIPFSKEIMRYSFLIEYNIKIK